MGGRVLTMTLHVSAEDFRLDFYFTPKDASSGGTLVKAREGDVIRARSRQLALKIASVGDGNGSLLRKAEPTGGDTTYMGGEETKRGWGPDGEWRSSGTRPNRS